MIGLGLIEYFVLLRFVLFDEVMRPPCTAFRVCSRIQYQ